MITIKRSIKGVLYDTIYGIQNLFIWLPTIWKDRNWDYEYIYRLLYKKLCLMEKCHKKFSPAKGKPKMIVTQTDDDLTTDDIPMWKKCHFPSEEAYNAQLERAKDSGADDGYGFDEIIASHTKEKEIKESNLCPWEDED